jgi:hypothetical protein
MILTFPVPILISFSLGLVGNAEEEGGLSFVGAQQFLISPYAYQNAGLASKSSPHINEKIEKVENTTTSTRPGATTSTLKSTAEWKKGSFPSSVSTSNLKVQLDKPINLEDLIDVAGNKTYEQAIDSQLKTDVVPKDTKPESQFQVQTTSQLSNVTTSQVPTPTKQTPTQPGTTSAQASTTTTLQSTTQQKGYAMAQPPTSPTEKPTSQSKESGTRSNQHETKLILSSSRNSRLPSVLQKSDNTLKPTTISESSNPPSTAKEPSRSDDGKCASLSLLFLFVCLVGWLIGRLYMMSLIKFLVEYCSWFSIIAADWIH